MSTEFYLKLAIFAIGAFLIGGIPFGYIIGKLNGKDIRKEGSCNIGATNVTRVVGKWWGKLCFLLDFLKKQSHRVYERLCDRVQKIDKSV